MCNNNDFKNNNMSKVFFSNPDLLMQPRITRYVSLAFKELSKNLPLNPTKISIDK